MSPSVCIRPFRIIMAPAAMALSLSVLAGLSACKPVDLSNANADTTAQVAADSAVLRISNFIQLFPDSLDFFRFPGTAADFSTATDQRLVGGVGVGRTGVFKVPAGTWKFAYRDQAGVLTAMRGLDSDAWLKGVLSKNGDYSLILSSEGQNIRWTASFPTDTPAP